MAPLKVMMCSTNFASSNGYSRISVGLINYLAKKQDLEIIHWAFQNFPGNPQHAAARKYPSNVQVYDAFANEVNKALGFGFEQIKDYVDMTKPDVIWIYNDMIVVSNILEQLKKCEYKNFKVIVYMDQVYLTQRKEFIKRLNEEADFVILFTPFWEECVKKQGLIKPTDYLQHGFDPHTNYPVPKNLARLHFGLKPEDFIVITTVRNVPRKAVPLTIMAWAKFVSHHQGEPVKLLLAMHPTQGAWNLIELYEHELREYDITLEEGMKHIILIDNPQQLTDEDLNTLYNAADVGINTTQGAGFELTTFEHGGIGIPQIATYTGGIRDFLDTESGIPVMPIIQSYTDMTSDGCNGKYEMCHPDDFTEAIETYYVDEEIRKKHGANARKKMLTKYKWEDLGEKLYTIFMKVANRDANPETNQDINTLDSNIISLDDINALDSGTDSQTDSQTNINSNINLLLNHIAKKEEIVTKKTKPDIKARLQAKLAAKKTKIKVVSDDSDDENIPIEKLLKMKTKIDKLLENK
jgi:glycosyltransferase involved in cell wall biosynthesis